eukprot:365719-Chlamydomonas_euryale.AAC.8
MALATISNAGVPCNLGHTSHITHHITTHHVTVMFSGSSICAARTPHLAAAVKQHAWLQLGTPRLTAAVACHA